MTKSMDGQIDPNEAVTKVVEMTLRSGIQLLLDIEPDGPTFVGRFVNTIMQDEDHPFRQFTPKDDDLWDVAALLGLSIWKKTPLPSNDYQPSEHWPDDKDPCWCGSKRAFSRCCGNLISSEGVAFSSQQQNTTMLLELIPIDAIPTLYLTIPSPILAAAAVCWTSEGDEVLLERARQMIEPMLIDNKVAIQPHCEHALRALLVIYFKQGKEAETKKLLERMLKHPDRAMKKAALEYQCQMLEELGQYDEAKDQFQLLQKVDPDNINLPFIELKLLASLGERETFEKRSQFWLQRLKKRNKNGELDEMIMLVEQLSQILTFEMIDNEQSFPLDEVLDADFNERPFIGKYDKDEVLALGNLLIDWLKEAKAEIEEEEPMPELMHEYSVRDGFAYIEPKTEKMKQIEKRWTHKSFNFDDGMGKCKAVLEENPELVGSIFVISDLLRLFDALFELSDVDGSEFFLILYVCRDLRAVVSGQVFSLIPEEPPYPLNMDEKNSSLILDCLYEQACYVIDHSDPTTGIELLECAMLLDAEDIRDHRKLLVPLYMKEQRDQDVIRLCEQFPDDRDFRMLYSYPLALFRIGDKAKATQMMKKAWAKLPKIAEALLCEKDSGLYAYDDDSVKMGSDEEASLYRRQFRETWMQADGAIACLKSCKRKN